LWVPVLAAMFGTACMDPAGAAPVVVGWFGLAAAWLLFLAPASTMKRIIRTRNIGDFSPLPYLISMLQCLLWTVYALPQVTPDKTQPLITNGVGFLLQLVYVLIFIRFAQSKRGAMLVKFAIAIVAAAALCVCSLVIAPGVWHDFKENVPIAAHSPQTTLLGWICSVLNVAMYASPLSVVFTVIERRSVKNMPLPLTLGCGLCSAFWTAFAFMVCDYFILVPNALGLLLFFIQISVYRWISPFCGAAPEYAGIRIDDAGKPSEALIAPTADSPQQQPNAEQDYVPEQDYVLRAPGGSA